MRRDANGMVNLSVVLFVGGISGTLTMGCIGRSQPVSTKPVSAAPLAPRRLPAPEFQCRPARVVGVSGDVRDAGVRDAGEDSVRPDIEVDPADVNRVVRGHLGEIKACYEAFLRRSAGDVHLMTRFDIEPGGNVSGLCLDEGSYGGDEAMDRCLINIVSRWRFSGFERHPKPVTISYPFHFRG